MAELSMRVEALLVGIPAPFRGDEKSGIVKGPVEGAGRMGGLGIEGDGQADLIYHGGPDKAGHLYVQDHYPFWRQITGGHEWLVGPGAFGENIAASGLSEAELCLGDRFRLGTALVEVSQGRQPCWKLDYRFGRKDILATVVRTGKCGVYFRVIEEGVAQAGTEMRLVERRYPEWTITRLFHLEIGRALCRERVCQYV